MARVNVFLNDRLLDEINRQAKQQGIDRNSLIQSVLETYIQAKRREREEKQKRRKMQEACRTIDALAKKLGEWDTQVTIRKFRDANPRSGS